MMNIFDTHTHLNVDNFAGKEAEEIAFARELGVTKMNIVGFDAETIEKSLALSRQYDENFTVRLAGTRRRQVLTRRKWRTCLSVICMIQKLLLLVRLVWIIIG